MTGITIHCRKLMVGAPTKPQPKTYNVSLIAKFI